MAITLANITGGPQTGFVTPVFVPVVDTPPSINAKQWAITSGTGTMTGVDYHSVSKPFTWTFFRPSVLKVYPVPNPTTGITRNVGMNVYKEITRKGMVPGINQQPMIGKRTVTTEVPAGCDTYEAANVRALCSASIGASWQLSASIGDTICSGVM